MSCRETAAKSLERSLALRFQPAREKPRIWTKMAMAAMIAVMK